MKILLVGEVFSSNLGDPVICETVHNFIKSHYSDAEITPLDISGRISSQEYAAYKNNTFFLRVINFLLYRFSFIQKISPFSYLFYRDNLKYLRFFSAVKQVMGSKKFDLILFAGGALFSDYFAGYIYCLVRKALIQKTPVIFHACGFSTLSETSVQLLQKVFFTKSASKFIKNVSLRDSLNMFLKYFGNRFNVNLTNDIALCSREYFTAADKKVADIGIGVIRIPMYKDNQKQLIEHFINSNFSWKIFTNGAQYDQEFAEHILLELGIAKKDIPLYLVDRPQTASELIKTVTGFDRIISFRLHSQIIATSFGVPSCGLIWDDKVREFYNHIGFSDRCFYPEEIADNISKIIDKSYENMPINNIENCLCDAKSNLTMQMNLLQEKFHDS